MSVRLVKAAESVAVRPMASRAGPGSPVNRVVGTARLSLTLVALLYPRSGFGPGAPPCLGLGMGLGWSSLLAPLAYPAWVWEVGLG